MSAPDVAPELLEAIGDALFRAHRFVEAHGSDAERLRAGALLRLSPGAVRAREDALVGRAGEATDPCVAWRLLAALAEIRGLRGRAAAEIAGRAAAVQRADGSWRAAVPAPELDLDDALPPFTRGERDPWFVTGVLSALLARSAAVGERTLDDAAGFLAARFTPEVLEGAAWHGIAAYAAAFSNVDHEAGDGILQWCGRELEKGFRAGRIAALAAARVLVLCDARALPGASLVPSEILTALVASQAEEGGFGEGTASARLALTLDGIGALLHLAGLRPGAPMGR